MLTIYQNGKRIFHHPLVMKLSDGFKVGENLQMAQPGSQELSVRGTTLDVKVKGTGWEVYLAPTGLSELELPLLKANSVIMKPVDGTRGTKDEAYFMDIECDGEWIETEAVPKSVLLEMMTASRDESNITGEVFTLHLSKNRGPRKFLLRKGTQVHD